MTQNMMYISNHPCKFVQGCKQIHIAEWLFSSIQRADKLSSVENCLGDLQDILTFWKQIMVTG